MIHQYKNNGYNIVLDVNSGAVHIVDDITYDLIKVCDDLLKSGAKLEKSEVIDKFIHTDDYKARYKDISRTEIDEALDEIMALTYEDILFTEDNYESDIVSFSKHSTVVKALCLNVAHECNLACKYCFAGKGEYRGTKELMSLDIGKKAIDFLIANSSTRTNLEVDFFGGEPLLNFDVVKNIVDYAKGLEDKYNKHFRFTLTTNGVLLNDDIMEYLDRNMDNVVLSIDGREEVHNNMRPFPNGAASYDKIIDKFIKFAKMRGQERYYVRGTYTHHNLDFALDVLHLADLGFKQISVEPVVADKAEDYAIREEDIPVLFEQYDYLAGEIVKRHNTENDFNFFHYMIDLEGGPCVYKRLSGCGSGTEYLSITPKGEIYPCHQFVGNEDFIMGDVISGIKRSDIREKFASCNVYAKAECKECFAKFYCSGGCAANSYNYGGDILANYEIGCSLHKKRIEDAIMIKAATQ